MQTSSPAPPHSKPVKQTSPPGPILCSYPQHTILARSERRSSCTLLWAFPPAPQTEYLSIWIPSAVAGPSPKTSPLPPPSPASTRDTSSSAPDTANPPKTPSQSPPSTAPQPSGFAKRRLVGSQSPNSSQDFVPTRAPPWHHSSLQQFDVALRPCSKPLQSEICVTLFLSPPLRNSTKPLLAVRNAATSSRKRALRPQIGLSSRTRLILVGEGSGVREA